MNPKQMSKKVNLFSIFACLPESYFPVVEEEDGESERASILTDNRAQLDVEDMSEDQVCPSD